MYGSAFSSLFISEPSGAPKNLSLGNTTSTSIFVMWEAVSRAEQNGIIISYNVSYRLILGNGSGGPINSTLVSAPKMYVNLTGLIKDMYYNISVLASTRKGDGIYSNPKKFRTNEDSKSLLYYYATFERTLIINNFRY